MFWLGTVLLRQGTARFDMARFRHGTVWHGLVLARHGLARFDPGTVWHGLVVARHGSARFELGTARHGLVLARHGLVLARQGTQASHLSQPSPACTTLQDLEEGGGCLIQTHHTCARRFCWEGH